MLLVQPMYVLDKTNPGSLKFWPSLSPKRNSTDQSILQIERTVMVIWIRKLVLKIKLDKVCQGTADRAMADVQLDSDYIRENLKSWYFSCSGEIQIFFFTQIWNYLSLFF